MTKKLEFNWQIPIPEPLLNGCVFDRWTEEKDSIDLEQNCTFKVDEYGFFIYWKSDQRDGDAIELCQVSDIRAGGVPKDSRLLTTLTNKHGDNLDEKSLTICSGTDYVNINYQHIICPDADTAKTWKESLRSITHNNKMNNVCVRTNLTKHWMRLKMLVDVAGNIPVKVIARTFASGKTEKLVYQCLSDLGLPSGKNDTIDPAEFTFEKFCELYHKICPRNDMEELFQFIGYNGTVLVRLRAVAMERDDNSEGWVPIGAGGLSNVCIVKRAVTSPVLPSIPDAPAATATSSLPGAPGPDIRPATNTNSLNSRFEFLIYARRLIDNELVFRCTICKDFEYNKVMPTFHNWKTGGKRVGLIFQTAADGRVFDRGIMGVLVELSAGLELLPPSSTSLESDNEVFMAVELPYKFDNKRKGEMNSRHVSPTSTDSSSQKGTPPVSETELKTYRYKQQQSLSPKELPYTYQPSVPPPTFPVFPPHQQVRPTEVGRSRNAFYQPASPLAPSQAAAKMAESPEAYKKRLLAEPANPGELHYHHPNHPHHQHHVSSSFASSEKPPSVVCRYCEKTYTPEENAKGSCEKAPDCVRDGIHAVTCIPCARSFIFHCLSEQQQEGFVAHAELGGGGRRHHRGDCDSGRDHRCSGRWIGLTILSILLPCLWCYPLLKACHMCGVSCGACGGRHEPANGGPPPPHSSATTTS